MKNTKLIAFLLLLGAVSLVSAQELPEVVPPAPEVAALNKFVDIPVGHYSGLAQISIPVYQVSSRDISVPVSLNYHSAGIRVEEIASRVGLGWSLLAGGHISRTVRGIPDDSPHGFIRTANTLSDFESDNPIDQTDHIIDALDGLVDYESDMYTFNFLGHSGRFVFDQFANNEIVQIPFEEYKIEKQQNTSGEIIGWKVIDPLGYIYHFGNVENATKAADQTVTIGYTNSGSSGKNIAGGQYSSTWHLVKVESPISGAEVTFTYNQHDTFSLQRNYQKRSFGLNALCTPPGVGATQTSFSTMDAFEGVLSSINFENGKVLFDYNTAERTDFKGDHALTAIRVLDKYNKQLKKFELVQSYTVASGSLSTLSGFNITANERTHRLRLDKVKEQGEVGSPYLEYECDYYDESDHIWYKLPERFSYASDYWGFYNGKNSNNGLLPDYYNMTFTNAPIKFDGADKRVSPEHALAYSLQRLTYPTGGYVELNYESNSIAQLYNDINNFAPVSTVPLANILYVESNNSPNIIEESFSVTSDIIQGVVEWDITVTGCTDISSRPCGLEVSIEGVGHSYFQQLGSSMAGTLTLANGNYKLVVNVIGSDIDEATASVKGSEYDRPAPGETNTGGLRVKSIIADDGYGGQTERRFDYRDLTNGQSSGKLASTRFTFVDQEPYSCSGVNGYFLWFTSYSVLPTVSAGSGAGHVGYTHVNEYFIEQGQLYNASLPSSFQNDIKNGFTSYQFSFALDAVNANSESVPYTPFKSLDWRKGNLIQKSIYKTDNAGNDTEVSRQTFEYDYFDNRGDIEFREVKGMKVAGNRDFWFVGSPYVVVAGFKREKKNTDTGYNTDGNISVVTEKLYQSGSSVRPGKVTRSSSDNKDVISKFYYADQVQGLTFFSSGEKTILDDMATNNLLSTPVLVESYLGTESDLVNRKLSSFKKQGSNFVPHKTKIFNTVSELLEERLELSYDDQGNVVEVLPIRGVPIVYIWGYQHSYPLAKIENASRAEVSSYLGNIQTLANLDNDRTMGTSGTEGALRTALNNLRTQLPKALITSFTYDPGVGMTSQTTPNGITTYYEYDNFRRLKYVKDQDGNILKMNEYAYQVNANSTGY